MARYHPGHGLSSQATERLRERKVHAGGFNLLSNLPAEDESRQWEDLLGAGAKKKARCSQCTRPLGPEELACRQSLCKRCTHSQVDYTMAKKAAVSLAEQLTLSQEGQRHRQLLQGRGALAMASLALDSCLVEDVKATFMPGCLTPSTQAVSEADDASSLGSHPPTPDQVLLAHLQKRLQGEWIASEGPRYRFIFSTCDETRITCILQDSSLHQKYMSFYFDVRDRLVWWGTERSYFLDVSEIEWTSDRITWHDSGNGEEPRKDFEWHRPGTDVPTHAATVKQINKGKNKIPIGSTLPSSEFLGLNALALNVLALNSQNKGVRDDQPCNGNDRGGKSKQLLPVQSGWQPALRQAPMVKKAVLAPIGLRQAPMEKKAVLAPIGAPPTPPLPPSPAATAQPPAPQVPAPPQPPTPPESQVVVGRWRKQRDTQWQPAKSDRVVEVPGGEADLAALALKEVEQQLHAPDSKGFVWVDHWNERFLPSLGTLRSFLEERPDRFTVIPTFGRGFRVSLAKGCRKGPQWKKIE